MSQCHYSSIFACKLLLSIFKYLSLSVLALNHDYFRVRYVVKYRRSTVENIYRLTHVEGDAENRTGCVASDRV